MFVPTLRNGLSEEEAIQTYATFSKRPVDEIKEGILKKHIKKPDKTTDVSISDISGNGV